MSQRNESNIGESNKTSVKVNHNPGGQTNWSFGWGVEEKPVQPASNKSNPSFIVDIKYHNESNIVLGEKNFEAEEEEKRLA